MRKTTKWLVRLLVLTLVLGCTGLSVAAGSDVLDLSAPETVETGEKLTVSIDAMQAQQITDGVLTVSYDAELLTYLGASAAGAWSEDADLSLAERCRAADGIAVLSFASVDAAAKGSIFNLSFTAKKAGSAEIAISGEESYLTGAGEGSLDVSLTLTIQDKPLETFTVTFVDGYTKETISTVEVTAGEAAEAPEAPEHEGYLFTGWDKDFSSVTESMTVTAQYEKVKVYTVTFVDGYTKETISAVEVSEGKAAEAPAVSDHDGYYFLGWDKDFSSVTESMTVTALFCTGEGDCPSASFTDVLYDQWYHEGIDYAVAAGYMNGMGNNTFEPLTTAERSMAVTVLYRMAGSPKTSGKMPFADVEEGIWYYDAVIWACENGITNGVSATEFEPEEPLTREQFVTFLYRYAKYKGYDVSTEKKLTDFPFVDIPLVHDWASDAMAWAIDRDMVNGVTRFTLEPQTATDRAMIAKLLMCLDAAYES